MNLTTQGRLENPIIHQRYRNLPAGMFVETDPSPAPAPELIELNLALLEEYGVDSAWFQTSDGLSVLAGQTTHPVNKPIAMAYSGHQFGQWVPSLGDGRAHMLGQMVTRNNISIDVQLKGSGQTQFSRRGDGRATLGSVLREYLISEAMAGLGIPSTRSLAVITTGEPVFRERAFPGAILARTASSHLRVGSFQYANTNLGSTAVKTLADFMISHHYPELAKASAPYLALLDAVTERQARLIAQWMLVGFIHGVMNTDNMSIAGETIDFGPCAFIDEFHPEKVFSSIDYDGRYALDQQPSIAYWNLARFAETLLPLLDIDKTNAIAMAEERLALFVPRFKDAFYEGMHRKLGLGARNAGTDKFIDTTLSALAEHTIDYTVFFTRLTRIASGEPDETLAPFFAHRSQAEEWIGQWRQLAPTGQDRHISMRQTNPVVIARNHRVEQAIAAATENGDYIPFRRLCTILAKPFDVSPADSEYETPPLPEERVRETFCGT